MEENKFYIYIDESGPFKGSDHSFVGGFITQTPPEKLYKKIQNTVYSFQRTYGDYLGIDDIHAAEVLHPENFYKGYLTGEQKKRQIKYIGIDLKTRQEFISNFIDLVNQEGIYFIKSENKQFQFGEENPQSRYGNCLGAWFQKAIKILSEKEQKTFQIEFAISPRHKDCLPEGKNFNDYHDKMYDYIENLYKQHSQIEAVGRIPQNYNNHYFKNHGVWSQGKTCHDSLKNLLALSDIVCYAMRSDNDFTLKNNIEVTHPNDANVNSYQDFHKKSQQDLIQKGEIAAAYHLAISESEKQHIFFKEIIQLTEKEQPTQLRYFLNLAYGIVERRTFHKNALFQAKNIFEKILHTFQNSESEKLQEIVKDAINGLILCANHSGEIIEQIDLLSHAQKIIQAQHTLPALVRHAQILEIRNRAFNDQFNNYLFDEIIESFEDEVEKYDVFIK